MRKIWWQFQRPRIELYKKLATVGSAFLVAATSDTVAFVGLSYSAEQPIVFSHAVNILALQGFGEFAVVQSALHLTWARKFGSSLKGDFRYTTTDCLENFPFPRDSLGCSGIGRRYHDARQEIMIELNEGLTEIYGRIHERDQSPAIAELRRLQVEMDSATAAAYGWQDVDLAHGFHDTKQGVRFTIAEAARHEILDRLLALNHQRHAEEDAEREARSASTPTKRGRKTQNSGGQMAMDL